MTNEAPLISLEEAKALVAHLESGEVESANDIVHSITLRESTELFSEVGKLTRQLHDSLSNFQLDERITALTQSAIPDAQSRLEYVIEETEKAANSTMDAVEKSMPIAELLNARLSTIMPEWKKLMSRQIELGEFKSLCLELDTLLTDACNDSATLNSMLTEVLMAQGYQDLTGQVIRRVIELVKDVEVSLVDMLAAFSDDEHRNDNRAKSVNTQPSQKSDDKVGAEGPIIDAQKRDDVVNGQDDVDDLLSSLGF
ncbi:protein phosphatase CheZ [Glaciecola sp. XM2]|jgi:chemotaxis protein CheZ|uniref:protein phosphatase CheZ n=1 Tax=Glaciecola sp. XM2 TaxID=1914931 RepID=UPI001BDE3665|nr:protein phosphatase CheZ [Glaciecola sp. XM2]MBT1450843.1 protein phosphatase CheZ [Glaciecola sp. XM2]